MLRKRRGRGEKEKNCMRVSLWHFMRFKFIFHAQDILAHLCLTVSLQVPLSPQATFPDKFFLPPPHFREKRDFSSSRLKSLGVSS